MKMLPWVNHVLGILSWLVLQAGAAGIILVSGVCTHILSVY